MSLWNRIGEVATNAGKFVGEVAGGVAGSAKFAWDVATAPFNDAEQYNGFVNTFKSAYDENQKAIAKPIASVVLLINIPKSSVKINVLLP